MKFEVISTVDTDTGDERIDALNGICIGDRIWFENPDDPETCFIRTVTGIYRIVEGQYFFSTRDKRVRVEDAHRIEQELAS